MTQTRDQMQSTGAADVVVGKGSVVLQLFARVDESLLVRVNAIFGTDLPLDGEDSVRTRDVDRHRLAIRVLDKNLHSCAQQRTNGAFVHKCGLENNSTISKS